MAFFHAVAHGLLSREEAVEAAWRGVLAAMSIAEFYIENAIGPGDPCHMDH